MLNDKDIALLESPFLLEEHGFRDGQSDDEGKPYIHRIAIKHRLDAVDRGWQIKVHQETLTVIGDVVSIAAALTIKGVSHTNVSTGIIQRVKKGGEEYPPYLLAQNTALAIKSAASSALQRCAQWFGVAVYMKSLAFKGISTRDALRTALDKLNNPPHWASLEGGKRVEAKRKTLKLEWDDIFTALGITRLGETTLNEAQFLDRLDDIALDKLESTKPPATPRGEDVPINVRGSELRENDLIFMPGKDRPLRVMHIFGDAPDRRLIELIVWFNMDNINVIRQAFEKDRTYSVKRFSTLKAVTDQRVLRQVEQLKRDYTPVNHAQEVAT